MNNYGPKVEADIKDTMESALHTYTINEANRIAKEMDQQRYKRAAKSKHQRRNKEPEISASTVSSSPIITIDLPASAIVFTEDDGMPTLVTAPYAPVKQSNIKSIEWNFSFGNFATSNNFHIHKLPISAVAIDLLPTSTLKQISMLPYPKTEAGKQYYCIMVYAESDKELKSLQEIMLCSIGNHKGTDIPSVIVRSGNNEAVLTKGSITSAAIGHQYICWIDNADHLIKIRYLVQIVLEPSKLTYL